MKYLSTVFFFLLFIAMTPLRAQVPVLDCSHPDYDALESFFFATGGEDWNRSDGWTTTCDPCSWYGVRCDENDRVTVLALPSNNLVGNLPVAVGDLPFLSTLSVPENTLSGPLPASLFELDLWDLYLTKNNFSGTVPAAIGNLENLQYLRLDANQFTGELPASLADLSNLKRLYLNSNSFSGPVPAGLTGVADLEILFLQNNNLDGCLPSDLLNRCGDSGFRFSGNPGLPWSGDFASFCASGLVDEQIGAPCDDGDPDTFDDTINEDCDCGPQPDGLAAPDLDNLAQDQAGNEDGVTNSEGNVFSGLQAPSSPAITILARELEVYPNPASGTQLNISLPGNEGQAALRLLSVTGNVITERTFTGAATQLDIPNLEAGLYLVEAVAGGIRTVRRVMVN